MTDLIETESIRSGSFEFRLTILYPNTVAISRRPQFSDHLLTRLHHRQKIFTVFHIQYFMDNQIVPCYIIYEGFYTEISLFCYKNIKKGKFDYVNKIG